jgi:hypothetical protein
VRLPDLPSNSDTAFEDFHSFLYTGKVYTAMEDEENAAGRDNEWTRLTNAWILGEVMLSVSLKDAVVDAVLQKMSKGTHPTKMFRWAYKYGPNDSPFRRLMVDIATSCWNESAMSRPIPEGDFALLAPFYQSISVALLEQARRHVLAKEKKVDNPTKHEGTCFYHEHGDKPCYKTMF